MGNVSGDEDDVIERVRGKLEMIHVGGGGSIKFKMDTRRDDDASFIAKFNTMIWDVARGKGLHVNINGSEYELFRHPRKVN